MDNKTIVSLFLSEIIRSRKITIPRAAEISSQVLKAMEQLRDDETEMLRLLDQLEKDFQEVAALKQTLRVGKGDLDVRVYDEEIREYSAELFKTNMVASAAFLRDAARSDSIDKVCAVYPDFCNFLIEKTDKAEIVKKLKL
jgi:hypothetical protein